MSGIEEDWVSSHKSLVVKQILTTVAQWPYIEYAATPGQNPGVARIYMGPHIYIYLSLTYLYYEYIYIMNI
jgi:hypothetical protein